MDEDSVRISAVWLRRLGDHAQVLVKVAGEWRLIIQEPADANYSRVAESGQITNPTDKPSGSGERMG